MWPPQRGAGLGMPPRYSGNLRGNVGYGVAAMSAARPRAQYNNKPSWNVIDCTSLTELRNSMEGAAL